MRFKHLSQRRVVLVLALGLMASAAWADGSITFIHGGIGPVTNLNNGAAFNINLVNGAKTETFVNNTGKVIKDFHFTWADKLAVRGYDDLPDNQTPLYFGSYTTANKSLDFFDKQNGVGIGIGEKFEISIAGFGNMKLVTATPTFAGGAGATGINKAPVPQVPEPASVALGLSGMALVLGWTRRARPGARLLRP